MFFQSQSRLFGDEQIGTFNNNFKFGRATILKELFPVINIHCCRSSAAGHKEICPGKRSEVENVPELFPVGNKCAIRQRHLLVIYRHKKSIGRKHRFIEIFNHYPLIGKFEKFLPVYSIRIIEPTAAIYDGNCFIFWYFDFITAKVTIGSTCLNFYNIFFFHTKLFKCAQNILVNTFCCHAIQIMWNSSKFGRLSGRQGFSKTIISFSAISRHPVHELGCAFIRAKKKDFLFSVKIANFFMVNNSIKHSIHIVFKGPFCFALIINTKQNYSFRPTFRYIFVFFLLG